MCWGPRPSGSWVIDQNNICMFWSITQELIGLLLKLNKQTNKQNTHILLVSPTICFKIIIWLFKSVDNSIWGTVQNMLNLGLGAVPCKIGMSLTSIGVWCFWKYNYRQISLYVQRRIRVDVGHVFGVKTNPYLKIKYTFEIFHQPAVKL